MDTEPAGMLRPGYFTLDVIRTTDATRHVTIPGWTTGGLWNGW